MTDPYIKLIKEAKNCQHCRDELPNEPRPIFVLNTNAKLNIIGQAPGKLAHDSEKAWNDNSGNRLRDWLGIDADDFYSQCNIFPMSFCFPGYKNGADAPPLKPCAPLWHPRFLSISDADLTLYVGKYAQAHYLPEYQNLTAAVADWQHLIAQKKLVLPHPSGRNNRWLAKNSWFEEQLVPELKTCIKQAFTGC